MFKFYKLILILLAGIFITGGCMLENNKILPSRSDCIVKLEIQENNVIKSKVTNLIVEIGFNKEYFPVAGVAFPRSDKNLVSEYYYFQFYDKCKDRHDLLEKYLEYTVFEQLNLRLNYKIYDELIKPSVKTIEHYGEYWSDGKIVTKNE